MPVTPNEGHAVMHAWFNSVAVRRSIKNT